MTPIDYWRRICILFVTSSPLDEAAGVRVIEDAVNEALERAAMALEREKANRWAKTEDELIAMIRALKTTAAGERGG